MFIFQVSFTAESLAPEVQTAIPSGLIRDSPYLTHPIFNTYFSFLKICIRMVDNSGQILTFGFLFFNLIDITPSMSCFDTFISYNPRIFPCATV